jgi:uncharacterized membrane protein YedE/YeeE
VKPAQLAIAGLSGFMLAIALAFGQLTRPEIIIGWVDVFGAWNPHMAVFFLAAVLVYYPFTRLQSWRQRNGRGPAACLPTKRRVDTRLVIGSTIFGIGWAIGGVCPGPGLTSLGAGAPWAAVFVAAMVAGLLLGDAKADRRLLSRALSAVRRRTANPRSSSGSLPGRPVSPDL